MDEIGLTKFIYMMDMETSNCKNHFEEQNRTAKYHMRSQQACERPSDPKNVGKKF